MRVKKRRTKTCETQNNKCKENRMKNSISEKNRKKTAGGNKTTKFGSLELIVLFKAWIIDVE